MHKQRACPEAALVLRSADQEERQVAVHAEQAQQHQGIAGRAQPQQAQRVKRVFLLAVNVLPVYCLLLISSIALWGYESSHYRLRGELNDRLKKKRQRFPGPI